MTTPHAHVPSGRALVVDAGPLARGVTRVLRSALPEVQVQGSLPDAQEQEQWDLLVANYDVIPPEQRGRLRVRPDGGRLVVYSVVQPRIERRLAEARLPVGHALAPAAVADGEELLVTAQKMLHEDIFGLDKYFSWGSRFDGTLLHYRHEKQRAVDAARAFATGLGLQDSLVEQVALAADEFLHSALVHTTPHGGRAQGRPVTMTLGSDGRRVGISVLDAWGTLTVDAVLSAVSEEPLALGPQRLSLRVALEALSHLVINISPGRQTELIGLLDIRGSYRDFLARGKSVNVFVSAQARRGGALAGTPEAEPAEGRVLLLENDRPRARTISRVLRTAVREVETHASLESIAPDGNHELLIADFDELSDDEKTRLCAMFSSLKDRKRLLIYSQAREKDGFAELLGRFGITNVLARHGEVDEEELLVTAQKLLRSDIFGIEKYFPWAAHSEVREVRESREIAAVVDAAGAFAERVGVPSRLAQSFCTVADELTSNALYNAPHGADGKARYAHLPRTQPVALDADERIRVTLASDGRRLGISVEDPFGSLSADKVVAYLAKCFRRGEDQVDQKEGGAGLGLFCTFEAVSHFVVNIKPSSRTEMIGLLDIRGSYRDFAERGKSFNIFVED